MSPPPDDSGGRGSGNDSGANSSAGREESGSARLPACEAYRLRVLPAGKNDKVVEVSDSKGDIIKYLHSRYRFGNSVERRAVQQIKEDWQSMDADEFADKYGIARDQQHE